MAADQTTYFATGTVLHVHGVKDSTRVGELPPTEQSLVLRRGDTLLLTRDCSPAPVTADTPRIGCTLPEIFDHARLGQRVYLDDGLISGEIVSVSSANWACRLIMRLTGGRDCVPAKE